VDECVHGSHECLQSLASCSNTDGSYNCTCNYGYVGDGKTFCRPKGKPYYCRVLVFQGPLLFNNKRLVNHTIGYKIGVDFEDCEMHCYFEKNCVSVNYQVDTETCELNNATHLKYDENFIEENGYLYHGADVSFCFNFSSSSSSSCSCSCSSCSSFACDEIYCHNGGTCQSGFTVKGYRCLCPPGYTGERCETG
ncbi:unnamed protein product, partial [Porites evermanni]